MSEAFNMFKSWAITLKEEDGVDYQEKGSAVIDLMATRYVEAMDSGDERAANKYIAGLMMRFWNNVGKMLMKDGGVNLGYDEYISWLYEAIEYACKYRAWLDPTKKVNAQQAINMCIETIRRQHYYGMNLDKHKANYNALSLDAPMDSSDDDSAATLLDTIAEDLIDEDTSEAILSTRSLIQLYVDKRKLVEAIILDTIAFNDVEKVTKKTIKELGADGKVTKRTQAYREFWPYRCVQLLSSLPANYADYFTRSYTVPQKEFALALDAVNKATNQKLYRYVERTLSSAKEVFTY